MKHQKYHNGIYTTFLILFFSVCGLLAQAQQQLHGIVVEKGSPKRVDEATITNRRTLEKAISNSEGGFTIPAKAGDTLIVTKYAYSSEYYRIVDPDNIVVPLNPTIELQEVTVTGKTRKEELNDILEDYKKQGIYSIGKPKALSYLASPLTSLYGAFGRTAKNARRFNAYAQREIQETEVDKKFNKYNVGELTGLKGDDLTNFLSLYRPSYAKSRYWNEYDIQNYIKNAFEKFERDGRPKADTLPKIIIPEQKLNENEK
ncbi:hypothetical protein GCM10023231_08730 [Olivibacter ginsenosidimutans]|uniref:Carboxypeptidase-like regulatory domain-containing protein n=1 Tax=Olivibacter ginsenosidimutans TaxID=1176537 RepID=A0ABP9ANB2_9SPHI